MMRAPIPTEGRSLRPGDIEKQCSFCLKDRQSVESLVTAPHVSVCSECIARCVDELTRRRTGEWRRWWDLRRPLHAVVAPRAAYRTGDTTCSFCGQDRPRETLVADHARICSPCVRLALDVVREQRTVVGVP